MYSISYPPVAPKLCETLSVVRYQVEQLNNADKASRELYYHCVQDLIHQAILLFPIYVQHASKYSGFGLQSTVGLQRIYLSLNLFSFSSHGSETFTP